MTPRTFGLAKLIENAPAHNPKRSHHHVADEYTDMGDMRSAAELRRHLRGGMAAFVEAGRRGR